MSIDKETWDTGYLMGHNDGMEACIKYVLKGLVKEFGVIKVNRLFEVAKDEIMEEKKDNS